MPCPDTYICIGTAIGSGIGPTRTQFRYGDRYVETQGRPSADDYLPFFACKAVGDMLLEAAQSHPGCQILVLCGHTHGGGEVQMAENLRVVTGPAEYGHPGIQRILEIA